MLVIRSEYLAADFFSRERREHSAAFCCRLSTLRRWTVPLLNAEAVTRAICEMVARGAVSGVRCASGGMEVEDDDEGGERTQVDGEDRLGFSTKAFDVGEEALSSAARVSDSIRSIARRRISNAFRRSPL